MGNEKSITFADIAKMNASATWKRASIERVMPTNREIAKRRIKLFAESRGKSLQAIPEKCLSGQTNAKEEDSSACF